MKDESLPRIDTSRVLQRVGEVQQKLGISALGLMPPPYVTMIYNHGSRSYDLPVLPVTGGGPSLGSLAIGFNETATQCFLHPSPAGQAVDASGTGEDAQGCLGWVLPRLCGLA